MDEHIARGHGVAPLVSRFLVTSAQHNRREGVGVTMAREALSTRMMQSANRSRGKTARVVAHIAWMSGTSNQFKTEASA